MTHPLTRRKIDCSTAERPPRPYPLAGARVPEECEIAPFAGAQYNSAITVPPWCGGMSMGFLEAQGQIPISLTMEVMLLSLSRTLPFEQFKTSKMFFMLALNVLEEDQERLCLLGRQIPLSQASDEGALLRDEPRADFDVPPYHPEFSFAFAHRQIIAGVTRPGASASHPWSGCATVLDGLTEPLH